MARKRKHSANIETYQPTTEYPTPTKAKVQGAIEFLEAKGLLKKNANTTLPTQLPTKSDVYNFFDVTERSGQRMIQQENPTDQGGEASRRGHNQGDPERRGVPSKIGWEQLKRMEEIVNDGNIRHRALSWGELASRAGLIGENKVHFHTVRKLMQDQEYHKCIACTKMWLSANIRIERRIFARSKLGWKVFWDWTRVRWSDEIHFGLGPEKKLRIIRRPGERYCWSCIQERGEPPEEEKDKKRLHAWAAVGWEFKTLLIWYTTSNTNGKMSQEVYIKQILEPIVKPWLNNKERFILEEDRDSGHGLADNNNKARRWKVEHGLEYYFNGPKSPDLSVIESCFQLLKQFLSNTGHYDEETLKKRAKEG